MDIKLNVNYNRSKKGVTIMDFTNFASKVVVKITTNNNSTGTGFFFMFKFGDKQFVPTIITNKHVLEECSSFKIVVSKNDYISDGKVDLKEYEINDLEHRIINHPNINIDLCAISITDLLDHFDNNKLNPEITFLSDEDIPNVDSLKSLRYVEEIIMVGYPNGISDTYNNLPLFRNGITATHPAVPFNGEPHFIVDMTIVPGSSGSPVFLYNPSGYTSKEGDLIISERMMFLGINKAVFVADNFGEIKEIQEPTKLVSYSQIGINLGIIISSLEINVIKDEIRKLI